MHKFKYDIEKETGIPWKKKKSYRYLYTLACQKGVILRAFKRMKRGKSDRKDIQMVEEDLDGWVEKIQKIIQNTKPAGWKVENPELEFKPPKHNPVIIKEAGKTRVIYVPTMVELWIQHVIVLILEPIIQGSSYHHSYSSFPKRGSHRGMKAMKRWIQSGKGIRNFAQCDIRHFYDHAKYKFIRPKLLKRIKDISYLKDIVDEECDQSVRAGVLIERLKAYEPELPKDMEPMVYVNYCEESDLMNPRCQKLSELDAKTAEMDKEWYTKRDPKTDEPAKIAKIYVTVYYAEKGEQKLHHFKKSMDIGNGHGGIVSQLKYNNEMKLTDEYWINYQKGKGSEEFQKYMEDLTDMQNHVLPYLQSFCNLEEKGVKERREQQIAERNEGRVDERGTSTEANAVVKDTGKADRKLVQQKQAVAGKDKKLSIHERLEINKKIIQEKQGKDKPERGADLGVRTV